MTKSNHRVNVVRVPELQKHPNADSLSVVFIGGYQVVVKTDNYKAGDLAIYIQPDSVVPQTAPFEFLWADKEFLDGVVPEKYRRITVRRFRKEWSEGLLLPVTDFPYLDNWVEGEDASEILGIGHYEPPEPVENFQGRKQQYKWPPKSFRGWVYYLLHLIGIDLNGPVGGSNEKGPKNPPPVYDVEALKNFKDAFVAGENVLVTEKIHGSNARYLFKDGKMYAGSRKLWKSAKSTCIWRKVLVQYPWIEEWCRANEGQTLFGEVVPTQGGFDYGCKDGQVKFFAFDIYTENEQWLFPPIDVNPVPVLYEGPYNAEVIKKLVDGKSTVPGANHIREGVVVRPVPERYVTGLGRLHLKLVSNAFLEKQ
jgi:RNA ligase/PHA02142 OB-fold domain